MSCSVAHSTNKNPKLPSERFSRSAISCNWVLRWTVIRKLRLVFHSPILVPVLALKIRADVLVVAVHVFPELDDLRHNGGLIDSEIQREAGAIREVDGDVEPVV